MVHPTAGRLASILLLAALPTIFEGCRRSPEGFDVRALTHENLRAYQRALSDADLILVGELVSFDREWTGYSGILAVCTTLELSPREFLRGRPGVGHSRLTVENYMVGKDLWVSERGSSGGLRLNPSFFVPGTQYVAFLSNRYQFCGHPSLLFITDASRTNVAAITADTKAVTLKKHPQGGPPNMPLQPTVTRPPSGLRPRAGSRQRLNAGR